jgi:outer membrane autotransporter protein
VSGQINISQVTSLMGRAGGNIGGTFLATSNIALAPFLHASVWNEFGPQVQSTAFVNSGGGSTLSFVTNSDRVGTFGQTGVGVQFKVLDLNLLGFVRGDIRFGGAFAGQALNIGLRKQF